MTTIEKIKAEIDKRYAEYSEKQKTDDLIYYEGMADALDLFEQFIDTLESEKPMNLEELEKEISLWISENENIHHNDRLMVGLLKDVSNHFYDLGCTRTAEKYDEIEYNRQRAEESVPNDLEEAARKSAIAPFNLDVDEEHLDEYPYLPIAEQKFIEGAKWQKQQMMKGAVEGEITKDNRGNNVLRVGLLNNGFEIGDKVRIIIVKED